MNKTKLIGMGLLLASFSIISCQNRPTGQSTDGQAMHLGDNSENSLDWAGTYHGVLPCADCPGISTALHLHQEGTYTLETKYLERSDSVFVENGTFKWDSTGNHITLGSGSEGLKFQVGENQLFQLDMGGNRITGGLEEYYVLKKVDNKVTDIYWKLVEINGKSLEGIKTMKEPYLRLNTKDARAEATGGCNGMGGTYELDEEHNRLRFSQFISTQMACENMEIEQQLAEIVQRTDSYHVGNDTLQLFKARMAPLAKFKAVYVNVSR